MTEQDSANQALTEWLGDRDEPCPRCGYCLRGLVASEDTRCPECNVLLRLRMSQLEEVQSPWIGAYTVCAIAMGFDAAAAILLLFYSMFINTSGGFESIILALITGLMAGGCLVSVAQLNDKRLNWSLVSDREQKKWSFRIITLVIALHILLVPFAILVR